jgi:hypothetical protein
VATAADIDRLIEDGLNRYGSGDLDGALLVWEEALAIDPENPQANSYVDYVRMNYELLQTDSGLGVVSDGGFGIEDEPEYIIEITQGHEIPAADAPMYMDPLDEGWFMSEEQTRETLARTRSGNIPPPPAAVPEVRTISADLPPRFVELEAEEPPEHELELSRARVNTPAEISFDSATREYGADDGTGDGTVRTPPNEFQEEPSSFRAESTPLGFGNLETEIRKRDLGFVQPTRGPAQLEVRLRTPSSPPQTTLGAPAADDDLLKTSRGIAPITRSPAIPATTTEDDLIKSLPSPRPRSTEPGAGPRTVTPLRGSPPIAAPSPPAIEERPRIPTRDLPDKKRAPAPELGAAGRPAQSTDRDLGFSGRTPAPSDRAETRQGDDEEISLPNAPTRELANKPLTVPGPPGPDDFAINAPTQDLGLRAAGRPASVYPDEDAPTRQSDARQIRNQNRDRDEHSTQKLKAQKKAPPRAESDEVTPAPDGTRTDFVLPFDPIDARAAQILDSIDEPEPPNESKEDRTRRRISALIERANGWNGQGELDKAVAAVDLALSEDPNSALAQKLIHRNRDAIMNIFQAFLGDLDRQPELARPLHELANAPISPRAAFLLSRIDGTVTIDEILDVSGMPRLEAYRHLCQLFLRGILR